MVNQTPHQPHGKRRKRGAGMMYYITCRTLKLHQNGSHQSHNKSCLWSYQRQAATTSFPCHFVPLPPLGTSPLLAP